MLAKSEIFSILEKQLPYLREKFGVSRVAVFGSFAKDSSQKGSDLDLLIEFKHLPGLKFIELSEYLEEKIGRKVDILTPEGLKGIRLSQVAEDIKKELHYV